MKTRRVLGRWELLGWLNDFLCLDLSKVMQCTYTVCLSVFLSCTYTVCLSVFPCASVFAMLAVQRSRLSHPSDFENIKHNAPRLCARHTPTA